jgi:hypothetical protein
MRPYRSIALVVCAVGLAACGRSDPGGEAVAHVGPRAVTKATFAHWMQVLAPQHMVPDSPRYVVCAAFERRRAARSPQSAAVGSCRRRYEALKQQTLEFLISSEWLISAAADEGTHVTDAEVRSKLHEKEKTFPGGHGEFQESLVAIAHTKADIELEISSELAAANIEAYLWRKQRPLTQAQLQAYYRHNISHFEHAERREFYLVESIKQRPLAEAMRRQIVSGKAQISSSALKEHLERPPDMNDSRTIVKAIFTARLGVVSPPIDVNGYYFLVEIRKVTPAQVEPFARARAAIQHTLTSKQRRSTLKSYVSRWRHTSIARTICAPGFVVQQCREYHGARAMQGLLRAE